jgi:glycosyltransferase involved in cell wall biosynthesis
MCLAVLISFLILLLVLVLIVALEFKEKEEIVEPTIVNVSNINNDEKVKSVEIVSPKPHNFLNLEKTNSGKTIYEDPSAMVHKINRVNKPLPIKWNKTQMLNEFLYKEYQDRKYDYQKTPWFVAYHMLSKNEVEYSIVMPIFNQDKIICEILRNIFHNTIGSFELILLCDGCTDDTEPKIINMFEKENIGDCAHIVIVHIQESIFETACDNLGFKIASGQIIIEIQADMYMSFNGYNKVLEKPILMYNDIIAVSGRCCHDKYDSIGHAGIDVELPQETNDSKCYLMSTVNRGPLLFDATKLKLCNYLDEEHFALGDDEHDLFFRAWVEFGFRTAYVPLQYTTYLSDGSTRKQMDPTQKLILNTRTANPKKLNFAHFCLPTYRYLIEPPEKLDNDIVWVAFGNTETIHFANLELATSAHIRAGIEFYNIWQFNQFDAKEFFQLLPKDALHTRGFNYWSWKPWIIQQVMKNSPEDKIIIYADSGVFFDKYSLMGMVNIAKVQNYYFSAIGHLNEPFCKCELYPHVKNLQGFLKDVMIDASTIVLKNNPNMRLFVDNWVSLCVTPFLLSDTPSYSCTNSDNFIDHRHDQVLLTILAHNNNMKIETIYRSACHHRTRDWKAFSELWKSYVIDPIPNIIQHNIDMDNNTETY